MYVAFTDGSGGGDALGAVILLLTWLYFGGFVLLIGAVVNAAVADRLPSSADEDGETDDSTDDTDDDTVTTGDDKTHDETTPARRLRRDYQRLERQYDGLGRDRDLLANDLAAQRSRRYDLEDELSGLSERVDSLERENEALRMRLGQQRRSRWLGALNQIASHVTVFNVGTTRETETKTEK